jgi:outer membrane receptor protein involved in Fe transport
MARVRLDRVYPGTTILAMLLTAVPVWAFEGRVVDRATGAPVARAEVSVLGLPGVTFTDAEGRFTWKPDPQPPFEILVILPGGRFMRPVLVESLPPDGQLTIEVVPLAEEAITVVGSAPSIESTPGSATTTLTRRDLLDRQATTIAEMVATVAGVSLVSEGHAAVPAVRGLARGRTLILIDGARVTTERRVGPSATFLDPLALDSLEVSRGPGSVAYGSDAFGGVIYARTRRVEPGSPLRARVRASIGTGVPTRQATVELSRGFARGGLLAQASYRDADDYRSPDGAVFNSGWRSQNLLVRGETAIGHGLLSAGWQSDFGRDIGRPRDNSRTVRFFYPVEDSHRFTATYEVNQAGGFDHLDVTAFVGSSALVTDQDRFPTATRPRVVERADVSARDFQVRSKAERLIGPAKLSLGADLSGRYGLRALDLVLAYDAAGNLASTTENVSIDRARRVDLGVFASLETPLAGRLALAGGLRADRVTTRNRGGYFGDRETVHGALSGFVSLTAPVVRGLHATAQIARGFRDPTLSDRYYRGPTGRGFVTGNPGLTPETSLQLDAGLRYTAGRARLAVFAYQYRIADLVERYQTAPDFFDFRNRGRARLRGVEVELQGDFGRGWSAEVSAQLQRGRALDDGAWLDDVSADTVSLRVRRRLGERGAVQVQTSVFARDDRPGPTEQIVGAHTLVDVSASYRLAPAVELRVVGRNLLDRRYLLSPDTRAVLAPGASALATLVVTLF